MLSAKKGDTVKVHYTGKLTDGTIFDESLNRDPLEFKLGENQIIPGFEDALIGMKSGEWKTVTIPADQAYGKHMPEMVLVVDRKELPPDLKPVIGQQLQVSQDDQHAAVVTVTNLTDTHITLDGNHPLAGKDLVFDINLISVTA